METKYVLKDITPENFCVAGIGCPAIYEVVSRVDCIGGLGCPTVYKGKEADKYLIVGKNIDPKIAGLEDKVGQGEALIEVPKELIDLIKK